MRLLPISPPQVLSPVRIQAQQNQKHKIVTSGNFLAAQLEDGGFQLKKLDVHEQVVVHKSIFTAIADTQLVQYRFRFNDELRRKPKVASYSQYQQYQKRKQTNPQK
uniref:Uncharacterized protein n=1 Tax=Spironucleus salmonicida TaxID=348837 RepID=V6LVH0_9EUKA|eukprot:EST44804.1 Hypothetical protein SS50377_15313 [Spironucleus salmonicida]